MQATAQSAVPDVPRPADILQTSPLSPALGAEITGIDLSQPMGDELFAEVLHCWHENIVLLLRDQNLSEDDQVRLAERFGPLAVSHTRRFTTGNPAVMLISNIRQDGKPIGALPDGEMQFHSDQCYQEKPAKASMLYAIEIPSQGGNTLFANAYKAYETLSDDIKRRIEGRKAIHAYDYDNASTRRGTRLQEGVPFFAHPIVRTHPATGRKALYVNRLMTIAIEGLPGAESDELLNFLFDHQENPAFIYEHVWRCNDLLLWDNRCALHARTDFRPDERRLMRRVTILGEKPA
jgi:alpha-ketoglutarate-dependent taurine dioxygenase